MMIRATICAIAMASLLTFVVPVPTQAAIVDPGLNRAAQSTILDVAWRHRRWHHRRWHCWHKWVRVRVHHHWELRKVRRCAWRYR